MSYRNKYFSGWIFIFLLIATACNKQKELKHVPSVIVLSLDGFRWDYPDIYSTPNLDMVASKGIKAESLIPVFPTNTFPNHYSIATGLYPDNHGLVNNKFFDPQRKEFFRMRNRSMAADAYYFGGEPIWVTAKKAGIPTATFYWVGSEAPVKGVRPGKWKKFDSSVSFGERMDTVIKWTSLKASERPRLIMWYVEEPDHTAHDFGPLNEKTRIVVERIDSLIGEFIKRLYSYPDNQDVNLIILSDHGMGEINNNKYIGLGSDLKDELVEYVTGNNSVLFIQPEPSFKDTILALLKRRKNLRVWRKEEIPEYLHFGNNPRISEIVAVADSGWSIGMQKSAFFNTRGAHGYDYKNKDMHGIFYGWGPQFKEGYKHPSFYNIDVYLLLTEILHITPAESDGNFQRVKGMLRKEELSANEQQ